MDIEKADAIPSNEAPLVWKEIVEELQGINRLPQRARALRDLFIPCLNGRSMEGRVHRLMIDAGDLQCDEVLQLCQRENGGFLRWIIALVGNIGKRGARQQMNGAHGGADEPFD